MARKLRIGEPVADELMRLGRTLLKEAVRRLDDPDQPPGTVHSVRKRLKAARALARFARPMLGKRFRPFNVDVRDAARLLSEARDSEALNEAIAFYGGRCGESLQQAEIGALHEAALAERVPLMRSNGNARPEALALLRKARRNVADWPLAGHARSACVESLRRTHAEGIDLLTRSFQSRDPDALHEARKKVVLLRYQLGFIRDIWPPVMAVAIEELQGLRQALGDHNDLILLRDRLEAGDGAFAGIAGRDPHVERIDRLRGDLIEEARARAARVYAEKPSAFAGRYSRLWRATIRRPGVW